MQKNKAHVCSSKSLGCTYILPTEGYPGLLAQHTLILTQGLVAIYKNILQGVVLVELLHSTQFYGDM